MRSIQWLVFIMIVIFVGMSWEQHENNRRQLIKGAADFGYTCAIAGMNREQMQDELKKSINGR